MMFAALSLSAATYYVSPLGNDTNTGLTEGQAWKTTAKVNAALLNAGDQVLFERGGLFAGPLILTRSGSSGNPIVIGAYGSGNKPVISGFAQVGAWTSLGSNIWESTAAVTSLSDVKIVTVNGVNTPMGRYPNPNAANSGYLTFQSHFGSTSITSNGLTGTPNWTGAEVVIRPNRWILNRCEITSQSGGTIVFSPATSYTPIDGFGFFIQDDVRTLDSQNEWFFDPATKKLKIYSSYNPGDVKVCTVDDVVTVNASYVTIQDIAVTGANDNLLTSDGVQRTNLVVQRCDISYSGGSSVNGLLFDYFTFSANTVRYSNNNGMTTGTGDHITVTDNTIEHIGIYPGMGTLIYHAISTGENTDVLIARNRIYNVGYVGISFYSSNCRVINNLIDTYCKVLDDGGGIYTYTGARAAMENDTIRGNIVLNGIGARDGSAGNMTSTAIGIYLDSNSKNVEVSHNTVANSDTYGMLLNNPNSISIHSNTIFNCSPAIRFTRFTGQQVVALNTVTGNKMIAKMPSQKMFVAVSAEEDLSSVGNFDQNYYCSPIDDTALLFSTSQPSAPYQDRTFSSWKTYLGKDGNSRQSPKVLTSGDDLAFAYNASSSPIAVTLPFPGVDASGNRVLTTTTLQPWTSVVVFKDLTNTGQTGSILTDALGKPLVTGSGNPLVP